MKFIIYLILGFVAMSLSERVSTGKFNTILDLIKSNNIVSEFYNLKGAINVDCYTNGFKTDNISTTGVIKNTIINSSGLQASSNNKSLISSQNSEITFEVTPASTLDGAPAVDKADDIFAKVTLVIPKGSTFDGEVVKNHLEDNKKLKVTYTKQTTSADGSVVVVWGI